MLFKDIIQPKTERRKYAEETLIINYFYVNYLGKELLVSSEAEECDLKMSASTNLKRRPWLNVIGKKVFVSYKHAAFHFTRS